MTVRLDRFAIGMPFPFPNQATVAAGLSLALPPPVLSSRPNPLARSPDVTVRLDKFAI